MDDQRYGTIPRDALLSLSGQELFDGISDGDLPMPTMGRSLAFHPVHIGSGTAVFEGTPTQDHLNPLGTVHGGYAATMLDSAMACAIHSTLPPRRGLTTIDLTINFVRPITPGTGAIRATGTLIHGGGRIATAEGRLEDEDGKLLAHGLTTCMLFPLERGPA